MRKAVIYARFSCSKQREASIEDQVRVCTEWCMREGYAVVGTYCDHAVSGTTDDRPEFQRMIANAGESDVVVVYMMDRFSRNEFDAPIYKRELQRAGVKLVSAMESIPDSPEGVIYEKLLEGLAACESMKTSVRTRRGMEGNALKCMHNGVRVYGYRHGADGRFEVDEGEAEIVREVFERRAGGESCNSIARDLALRGVKTYLGNPVADSFVRVMIASEKYKGVYIFGDVRIEGGMPRIVDDDLWAQANAARSRKERRAETWRDYPLSGKMVCAQCGRSMYGTSGRGQAGRTYSYYACKKSCVRPVAAGTVEEAVADAIRSLLADRETSLAVARSVAEHAAELARSDERRRGLQSTLEEARRGQENLMRAIESGIRLDGMAGRVAELREQERAAAAQLAMLDAVPQASVEDFADFLAAGATLPDGKLIDAFVYRALLYEDEVVVVLNLDIKKGEPAVLSLVRTDTVWLPLPLSSRTASLGSSEGMWLMKVPLAA